MSSLKTYLARERRLAKSAKAYNRETPTVTVTASDAAVTAAYKRGLKEGRAKVKRVLDLDNPADAVEALRERAEADLAENLASAYIRGLQQGAKGAHAAAAEIIADAKADAAKDQVKFAEATIETMDREMVQGWMNVVAEMNRINPHAKIFTMSIQMTNAICRELGRAYDRAPPAKGEQS